MDAKKLTQTDFNVKFINALQQFWKDESRFDCIGNPKKYNLLLLVKGCSVLYVTKDGVKITAESGSVVYTPTGSEYTATVNKTQADGYTIGVNFMLFDENAQPQTLGDGIKVFNAVDKNVEFLLRKISDDNVARTYLQNRIILMGILFALTSAPQKSKDPVILPALQYLTDHPEKITPVSELAKMCSVSEVYFRKKFKQSTAMSPIEYRNELRLERAKSYLERGDKSIGEISDELGYSTVSHFIQQFKKRYTLSPFSYKKDYKENHGLL